MLKFVFQNYLKDEYQAVDKESNIDDDYYLDDYKDSKTEDTYHSQRNNKFVLSVTNHIHYTGKENNNLDLCTLKTPTSWAVISEQGDADCTFEMRNGVKDDYGFFIDFETVEIEVPFIKKRIQTTPTRRSTHNLYTTVKEVDKTDDEKKKPYDKKPEILFLCLTTMSIVIILTFS